MNKQTLIVTATQGSNASGAGVILAKGHGKQKTTRVDPALSVDANFGAAVGALLNVLTDDRQQSMLRHPSAKSRIRVESLSDAGGKQRWTVNV
jgi:hypothetical protein